MTMIITMIRPEGIWQSADNRVTLKGKITNDMSPKQLHIVCPPIPGGPEILMAFTGIACSLTELRRCDGFVKLCAVRPG